jgi:hypothetical protein
VKIKFYAHASFRLEADGLAVITDPYTPGPHNSGFDPIDEPADVVIMSSATDPFHSDPSHVRGDPPVVNALELPPEGAHVRGLHAVPSPRWKSRSCLRRTSAPSCAPCGSDLTRWAKHVRFIGMLDRGAWRHGVPRSRQHCLEGGRAKRQVCSEREQPATHPHSLPQPTSGWCCLLG